MALKYVFGGFVLDPQRRCVVGPSGADVRLKPRAFDALLTLVRQPGRLITKAAMMKAVWPTVVVGDNSLDQVISQIRRALAGHGAPASWIATERGRGYRFPADVQVARVDGSAARMPSLRRDSGAQAERLHAQAVTLSTRPSADNLAGAFGLLRTALTIDPGCAPALAYRSLLTTVCMAFDIPVASSLAAAERDSRQALEIDPEIAQGHHGLANIAVARCEWSEAELHFATASRLEVEPHARVSRIYQLLQAVGHLRSARAEAESIDRLSASQPLGIVASALAALLLGDDAVALRHAERASTLGWPKTHPALQEIYFQLELRDGQYRHASECLRSSLSERMRQVGGAEAIDSLCAALSGTVPRSAGVTALRRLVTRLAPVDLGVIDRRRLLLWLTMLGAVDDAFEFAAASLANFDAAGLICARGFFWMPEMKPFRSDARFLGIVTALKFPEHWQQYGAPDADEPLRREVVAATRG